ncbi:MAG: hypothetical protein ACM30I_13660 [Gemmatimonas sp.]
MKPSVLPNSVARVCAAVMLSAFLTAGVAAAELPTRNVTERDQLAFQFRHLQTELMVAALSCGRKDIQAHYNNFVARFGGALKANGVALRSYFGRMFGAKQGEREMDSFMTRLSNELSLVSMREPDFCDRSVALFRAALAVPQKDIETFAQRHLTEQVAQRSGS